MAVVIPGAPNDGGDLAKYLSSIEGNIGWIPNETSQLGKELFQALKTDNDPSAWVSFTASSLQTVWEAMPADLRNAVQLALRDLIDLGLARVQEVVSASASAAVASAADAVPLIGTIIKALLIVVDASIDYSKQIDDQSELFSETDYWGKRFRTIADYTHPNALVYQQMRVQNYFDYTKKGNKWHKRPCYARSTGAADQMFLGVTGLSDKGACSTGVEMDCPSGSFFLWEDCHQKNGSTQACIRSLSMSSLFYPFWSAAYPDAGIIDVGPNPKLNPNTLLTANQYALISSPSVNLRVDGKRLLSIRDRFQGYFFSQAEKMAPNGGTYGLIEIDNNGLAPGTPVEKRLTIDKVEEEKYTPYQERPDKFFIDKDGLIRPYPNSGADPNKWGIRAMRGPQTPQFAAISVAKYNAVIGSTLAFMSARANFLRSGLLMKALLHDFGSKEFDSAVRKAMKYSADFGGTVPMPSIPPRMQRPLVLVARPIRMQPGSFTGSSGLSTTSKVLIGAGVAGAGYYVWRRVRRKK